MYVHCFIHLVLNKALFNYVQTQFKVEVERCTMYRETDSSPLLLERLDAVL